MQKLEPDGADEALMAIAEAALPAKGEPMDRWTERELMRLAARGRLTGDISGAVAAHRLLANMHGSLRGGYGEQRGQDLFDMTPEEEEEAILQEAEVIKEKRRRNSA